MYYTIDLKTLDLREYEKYPMDTNGLALPGVHHDKASAHRALLLLLMDRSLKSLKEHVALQIKIVELTQKMEPKKEDNNV